MSYCRKNNHDNPQMDILLDCKGGDGLEKVGNGNNSHVYKTV